MGRTVIVGGGVAGLTVAYQLASAGIPVTVLEKESSMGGLARSFQYGDYIFDIGPHRFHTDDEKVSAFIHSVLKDDELIVPRHSGVWMFNHYHDWPLNQKTFLKMPLPVMLRAGFDLFSRQAAKNDSFEDYILAMYGRTLYEVFFRPYTTKFIRLDPAQVHSDWAVSGVDRAVIDKDVKMNSLVEVLKSTLLPKAVNSNFVYPASGGIDVFSEKLAGMISASGGDVLTNAPATDLEVNDGAITSVHYPGGKIDVDYVIWSAPIGKVTELLGVPDPELRYLSIVCYNFEITGPAQTDYQWCYFGDENMVMNRISVPSLFNPGIVPPGKSSICIEVTCLPEDEVWSDPERLVETIKKELLAVNLVRNPEDFEGVHIVKVPDTYPIYEIDFRRRLDEANVALGRYENLQLLGRTGTFWYNNMDHSIRMALDQGEGFLDRIEQNTGETV